MGFKRQYIRYTKLAENKIKLNDWFSNAVIGCQRKVDATKIKYRPGGIVYFSYNKGKAFTQVGIITGYSNGVVTYIGASYDSSTDSNLKILTGCFKISDANKKVMAYVEY